MSDRMTSHRVISAIHPALTHWRPAQGLIHPPDRGSQSTRVAFHKRLKTQGITAA